MKRNERRKYTKHIVHWTLHIDKGQPEISYVENARTDIIGWHPIEYGEFCHHSFINVNVALYGIIWLAILNLR